MTWQWSSRHCHDVDIQNVHRTRATPCNTRLARAARNDRTVLADATRQNFSAGGAGQGAIRTLSATTTCRPLHPIARPPASAAESSPPNRHPKFVPAWEPPVPASDPSRRDSPGVKGRLAFGDLAKPDRQGNNFNPICPSNPPADASVQYREHFVSAVHVPLAGSIGPGQVHRHAVHLGDVGHSPGPLGREVVGPRDALGPGLRCFHLRVFLSSPAASRQMPCIFFG